MNMPKPTKKPTKIQVYNKGLLTPINFTLRPRFCI